MLAFFQTQGFQVITVLLTDLCNTQSNRILLSPSLLIGCVMPLPDIRVPAEVHRDGRYDCNDPIKPYPRGDALAIFVKAKKPGAE